MQPRPAYPVHINKYTRAPPQALGGRVLQEEVPALDSRDQEEAPALDSRVQEEAPALDSRVQEEQSSPRAKQSNCARGHAVCMNA